MSDRRAVLRKSMGAVATPIRTTVAGKSPPLTIYFGYYSYFLDYSSYVWLVPEFTNTPEAACTGFQVHIQATQDTAKDNLAQGDAGIWRYLVPIKDQKVKQKITEVYLFGGTNRRVANIAAIEPGNFDGMTINMNTNRGDYCLYLLWKCVEV